MLSVIIITKNESDHIEACLQSVAWADEIIVLDSGSTDDTYDKCLQYTERVYQTDWPGFGLQKQRALDKAHGDWVFSIDADEIMPDELAQEIQQNLLKSEYDAFNIPRLSSYCGQPIRHGGWWPDHTPRLFRRSCGRFSADVVHERIIINGRIGYLQQPLIHNTFTDLDEVIVKMNHYSSLGAQMRYQKGQQTTLSQAILRAVWTFLRTYLIKGACLEGGHGLMLSLSNAEGTYYKYAKLWLLQQKKQP